MGRTVRWYRYITRSQVTLGWVGQSGGMGCITRSQVTLGWVGQSGGIVT